MVNLFEISVNVLEELIIITFLTLYFGNKYGDFRKYIGFIAAVTVSSAIMTLFNYIYIYEGFLCFIFIFINSCYALVFLKGDSCTKIFISSFIDCTVYFIALFTTLCISLISDQSGYKIYDTGTDRIAAVIISKLLLITACAVLLKFRFNNSTGKRSIALLVITPIAAEMSMIGIMKAFLKYSELNHELMLASVSVMAANIVTYYVFIKINNDAEREMKIKALEQKEEYDRKHAGEIEELYAKTCGIRHDLLQHFTILQSLLNEDNEKAGEYIRSITREQIQEIRQFIRTDNDYFDAIANAKLAVCEKLGIKVRTRIMNGSLGRLNNYEIASLFGNLFDNAIEASKNSEHKRIDLDVQLQKGHLSIFMKNTVDSSVLEHNKQLITTKKNKEYHGLGIKNIQKIVDTRRGIINYFEENGSAEKVV